MGWFLAFLSTLHQSIALNNKSGCRTGPPHGRTSIPSKGKVQFFHITCQIVKLLGFQGCSQSPAGPLDEHVGAGAFHQSAAHDQVLQVGRAAPESESSSWDHSSDTLRNINTVVKVHHCHFPAGSGLTAGNSGYCRRGASTGHPCGSLSFYWSLEEKLRCCCSRRTDNRIKNKILEVGYKFKSFI